VGEGECSPHIESGVIAQRTEAYGGGGGLLEKGGASFGVQLGLWNLFWREYGREKG